MKKKFISIVLPAFICLAANAQTVTVSATGAVGSYITGASTATTRTDNAITVENSATQTDGYAVFNLASAGIPAGAVISSVTVTFSINSLVSIGVSGTSNAILGAATDFSTVTDPPTLFADCNGGTVLSPTTWASGAGSHTVALSAAGNTFIQNNLAGTVSLAFTVSAASGSITYGISGEATNTTPKLTIAYTVPVACTGTPTAGTVSPLNAALTCNTAQTLTLSGATNGIGITYQWETNTGSGFVAVPGATNTTYAGTFTAPSTSVYCLVTCTLTGLSAPSDTATVTVASGTPVTGVVSPASANVTLCSPTQLFTLSGATVGTGITYQWQTNTGSGFTVVPGATDTTYTGTFTASSTTVNCLVTCTLSSSSASSNTATVTLTSTPPVAGPFTASKTTGCVTYSSILSVSTPISGTGVFYQWQSSADGINYTSITGATNPTYTVSVSGNIYYRFYVKCGNSTDSSISSATELLLIPEVASVATLPYFQGFESWTGSCFSYDRPDIDWLNNPTSGNNSWRRNDEQSDASWMIPNVGSYTPLFTEGAHSARFHSSQTTLTGDLDLHINLSAAGAKTISFDYINSSGGDYLTVMLSENGGSTFTTLGTYQSGTTTGVTGWQRQTVDFTSVAANAIIRFAATGAAGSTTDIGIDSLYVSLAPACNPVTNLAATGITQTGATINWTTISGTAGYEVVVNTSSANPTGSGTGVTAATYNASGLIAGTVYYAHVRDSCGPGDFSAWTTITFTTNGTPPPVCDTIASLAVSGITSSSANLTWNVVTGTDGYEYVVSTSPTTPATGTGTVNHNYAATGLSANTIYHVFVRDSCGVGNFSAWDTLSFITKHSTGIASVNNDQFDVNAYPNPATDVVTIRAYGVTGDNRKVSLTDITGRVISTMDMATDRIDFNMSNLASGIYLVRYADDTYTKTIKVNKQ